MYENAPSGTLHTMRVPTVAATLVVLLALTGCAGSPRTEPVEEPAQRTEVPWDDYAPGLQDTIDNATCDELDEQFTNAVANNDRVAETTDHNNSDLMEYIDEAGEIAGC